MFSYSADMPARELQICSVYRWDRSLGRFEIHHTRSPRSKYDSHQVRCQGKRKSVQHPAGNVIIADDCAAFAWQLHPSSLALLQTQRQTLLAVGFSGHTDNPSIATRVYKLDTDGALKLPNASRPIAGSGFEEVLSVASVGVVDVEMISVNEGEGQFRDVLIIANGGSLFL